MSAIQESCVLSTTWPHPMKATTFDCIKSLHVVVSVYPPSVMCAINHMTSPHESHNIWLHVVVSFYPSVMSSINHMTSPYESHNIRLHQVVSFYPWVMSHGFYQRHDLTLRKPPPVYARWDSSCKIWRWIKREIDGHMIHRQRDWWTYWDMYSSTHDSSTYPLMHHHRHIRWWSIIDTCLMDVDQRYVALISLLYADERYKWIKDMWV